MGVVYAVIKFEYKFVDKLNDGSRPPHKKFLDKIRDNFHLQILCYLFGLFLMCLPIVIFVTDIDYSKIESIKYQTYTPLPFVWGTYTSAAYNTTSQYVFFIGTIIFLLPSLVNCSNFLKPLISSHLWHVMEEVTYSAFLIFPLISVWFFASREQNIILDMMFLSMVTISTFILSYIFGIIFYLLIERPFRNILDLIIFPKSTIFKKNKDIEDEESEETDTDDDKSKSKDASQNSKDVSSKDKKCLSASPP